MNDVTLASRRKFCGTLVLGASSLALGLSAADAEKEKEKPAKLNLKLGLDNFSIRGLNYNADQLIDYAASLKTDSLFITDLKPFTERTDGYLAGIKSKAADNGLQIQLGSWSICPTSKSFRPEWGSAKEHLLLGIRMAKALGSPVFRVILGNGEDRKSQGGIEARIADTVKVLKECKSQAVDAGVKIAVENHAGDMQAWELKNLIEQAGKDFVGANMDSGNAAWTMEDPMETLETLGAYVLTTSLRDSAIWEYADGAKVQWTAMGDGIIDWKAYFKRFVELCPNAPVHIETISGFPREIPYLKKDFWKAYPKARAHDLARFIALAKKGKSVEPHKSENKEAEQAYQKKEIERSIAYCKSIGLGLKT